MKFFGDACAAGNLASFEHERFQSCFGEIARRDQSIMPGADDDDVVCLCQFGFRDHGFLIALFAALPQHSAVRLCLTEISSNNYPRLRLSSSRQSLDE